MSKVILLTKEFVNVVPVKVCALLTLLSHILNGRPSFPIYKHKTAKEKAVKILTLVHDFFFLFFC